MKDEFSKRPWMDLKRLIELELKIKKNRMMNENDLQQKEFHRENYEKDLIDGVKELVKKGTLDVIPTLEEIVKSFRSGGEFGLLNLLVYNQLCNKFNRQPLQFHKIDWCKKCERGLINDEQCDCENS